MSDTGSTASPDAAGGAASPPRSAETAAIEADIEQTRERLAQTVDALGAKLDVKTRTTEKVAEVRAERGTEIAVTAGMAVALLVAVVVWRRRR